MLITQELKKFILQNLKASYDHHCWTIRNLHTKKWRSVVGLEIHAQISSKSKLFSGSQATFGGPLNSCVSLFDASIPGTLPVLNRTCVEAGIKTALALRCHINSTSMFDRKHYFYADLPAGYQITQQQMPLAINGILTFPVFVPGVTKKPYQKSIRLQQLQLEQDSGKSLHDEAASRSLVDLNRAGVPLMELVFDPGLSNGEEAAALVKELILILKRIGTCSCKMEEGALRVDANVSLHKEGQPLGTRTEIKNIGSVRSVAQAISYEIMRQQEVLDSGGVIHNETRAWDANSRKTVSMRDKEVQQDYRFMPEPNLPPLYIDTGFSERKGLIKVSEFRNTIPELPEETRHRLIEKMDLPEESAIVLVNEPILLEYFEEAMKNHPQLKSRTVANILVNDLQTLCNKNNIDLENCKITAHNIIEICELLQKEIINLRIARTILNELQNSSHGGLVSELVEKKGLRQINDVSEIEKLCKECIARNPSAVQRYKEGKKKTLFAIAGDVAKLSSQKANMAVVVKKLEELLNK